MSQVLDLRRVGVSYKIYDEQESRYVKTIYVINYNDVLECTGQYNDDIEFVDDYFAYALSKFKNFLDLSSISWVTIKDDEFDIAHVAKTCMDEGTDIAIVETLYED